MIGALTNRNIKGQVRGWYNGRLFKREHCCEWSVVLFLRNYIFQSAKKCEMTSFSMTSLHVDLNEAAKFVDIIPLTWLASLLRLRTLVNIV